MNASINASAPVAAATTTSMKPEKTARRSLTIKSNVKAGSYRLRAAGGRF